MSDTFSNLSVHVVFSTRDRIPMMTRVVRKRIFQYIGGVVNGLGGTVIAIGGTPDHAHLVARLPTNMCVADFVRKIKANSSKWINEQVVDAKFGWQRGYGAFSISQSVVSSVAKYVRNQERHHRLRSFEDEFRMLLIRHGISFDERHLR
jgi:REP element-mobilizing transposase RayT